jgi:hypothetical protein
MQSLKMLLFLAVLAVMPSAAHAWTCPAGERWVQVPTGTSGSRVVEGLSFQCQPPVDPKGPTSTSSATSSATASQSQGQSQQQGQSQSSNSSASAANNGNNSNNSTVNVPRQTPFAYSPEALPTSPCFKGYSAGASSPLIAGSFGGGKIDKGCEARETARSFALLGNPTAAAKLLCSTEASKRAGLTPDECMNIILPVTPVAPVAPAPVVIIVPSSVATPSPITPVAPNVALRVKARKHKPCAQPREK